MGSPVHPLASAPPAGGRTGAIARAYCDVRRLTLDLAAPLSAEDQQVQSMPDASPTKWHLAHVTWFFETFVLAEARPDLPPFDADFRYLFNSYYEAVGARHPRPARGLLTRPPLARVLAYRAAVDERMAALLATLDDARHRDLLDRIELGIHHEHQHQELLLTDILHAFAQNPLRPAYQPARADVAPPAPALADIGAPWVAFDGGLVEVGHAGAAFAFDNEGPRHRVWLRPFRLAARPVSNGAWRAFIDDGGYRRPQLWLADGWTAVQSGGWTAPLYWSPTQAGGYEQMTLRGPLPLDEEAPVCHVSYYEADAFARWAGARLPTEAEWEVAAASPPAGNTLGSGALTPRPACRPHRGGADQMFGDVWEWTQSAYAPYPGFRPAAGAVGEYNGKFMCNQMVLRGGSCLTPDGHIRASYRNFFYPHQRWQVSGLRLAEDA